MSFLDGEPNGYATGFFVAPGLVVTAYHVVSGELDTAKKLALGFGESDQLNVKVSIHGCQAQVVSTDKEADLALLQVCAVSGQTNSPDFQPTVTKDERVLLIARPHGQKLLGYGTFFGAYMLNGVEYWAARIKVRDGYSGSPLYNDHGELIGVFSSYDWLQELAVISPAARAQKLVKEFVSPANR